MRTEDGHVHVSEEEASAGSKEGVVRWVLAGGLILAIALLSLVWIIPALSSNKYAQPPTANAAVEAQRDATPMTPPLDRAPTDAVREQNGMSVIKNEPAAQPTEPAQ